MSMVLAVLIKTGSVHHILVQDSRVADPSFLVLDGAQRVQHSRLVYRCWCTPDERSSRLVRLAMVRNDNLQLIWLH